MLEKTFLQILNMSFTGSIVIFCVLIVRMLLKKNAKGVLLCAMVGSSIPSHLPIFL